MILVHNLNSFLPLRKPKVHLAFIFSDKNVFVKGFDNFSSQRQAGRPVFPLRRKESWENPAFIPPASTSQVAARLAQKFTVEWTVKYLEIRPPDLCGPYKGTVTSPFKNNGKWIRITAWEKVSRVNPFQRIPLGYLKGLDKTSLWPAAILNDVIHTNVRTNTNLRNTKAGVLF